jgi:hypothetical protein
MLIRFDEVNNLVVIEERKLLSVLVLPMTFLVTAITPALTSFKEPKVWLSILEILIIVILSVGMYFFLRGSTSGAERVLNIMES